MEIKTNKIGYELKTDNVQKANNETFADKGGALFISGKTIRFNGVMILTGKGTPLNVISAPLGSLYLNQSGGANTSIYVKETETLKGDKTGWTAK
jgi:hypothetical protein